MRLFFFLHIPVYFGKLSSFVLFWNCGIKKYKKEKAEFKHACL